VSAVAQQRETLPTLPDRQPRRRRAPFDVLRVPLLGWFLRQRWSRAAMQVPVLLVGAIMILHAFLGPPLAPKNLATLLTWVHFRGLVVLVILLAGNLFCMACPFMWPRELARRLFSPRWKWPRALRNKWPAIALFVLVLFAYELFDLWASPLWTGVLIVGYFAAALVVDALFQRASFCKYVCPIGQFNFLSSTMAPLEVAVRDREVCTTCETKDCIRGRRAEPKATNALSTGAPLGTKTPGQLPILQPAIVQRGCELALFQPRKVGNLDCTFCLDCVYACPHDNVGILARVPAEELGVDGTRSGIGKVERRFDFTVLAVVFTFGALLNAFAMISPVYAVEQWIAGVTGLTVEWPILLSLFTVALVLEPAILLTGAAAIARRLAGLGESLWAIVNRFARSLIPIGFGVWLAHYGFHFFTGFLTVIPLAQHAALQAFGSPLLGEPQWQLGGLPDSVVVPLEIGFLSMGLLGSWLVSWMIARGLAPRRTWAALAPWAVLHLLLYVTAVWVMMQPMDMRGTFLGG
jgi:ferredoxin